MAQSLNPGTISDPEQLRFNQKLVDKLKYCKEVLVSIKEASAGVAAKQSQEQAGFTQQERVHHQQQQAERVERNERVQQVHVPMKKQETGSLGNGHGYTSSHQQQGLMVRASRMALR